MKKIAIIGHFGGNENISDGQTVKTKILYEELSANTGWSIKKIDTYYKNKNPIKLFAQTIVTLISTKDIIILLSRNGMRFYFPILCFASRFLKTRVYHDVIGGNLDSYIRKYPKFVNYLNSFKVNWVETNQLKKRMEGYGVKNCEVMPNFKRLNIISEAAITFHEKKPISYCTFSRVMKEKGIEDAISAVESVNSDANEQICTLDIYGPIDARYKARFEEVMNQVTVAVRYQGIVPFDESVETIKDYSALLFPSYWDGEGFPGTIVDAYSAGLPVIATDWNCNAELIKDGKTGFLYSRSEENGLKYSILKLMEANIYEMKKNCLAEAHKYTPDRWIDKIIDTITMQKEE